jgi:hypothetical protein
MLWGKKIISKFLLASFTYAMLIILTYLTYSFATSNWKWSWSIVVGGAFIYLIALFTILFRFFRARNKNILTSLSLLFATMISTTALYLLLSFLFMVRGHSIWSFSWILFLIGILTYYITNLIYLWHNKKRITRKVDLFIISILSTVIIYLSVSFATGKWSVSWLIFIFALFLMLLTVSIDQIGVMKDLNKKNENIINEDEKDQGKDMKKDMTKDEVKQNNQEIKEKVNTESKEKDLKENPQEEKAKDDKKDSKNDYLNSIIESQAKKPDTKE